MKTEQEVLLEIGQRLKKIREVAGYTSYEHFAIEHDLSRMHYWKIEKGKANITIRTLLNILEIHKLSLEEFFSIKIEKFGGDNTI